MNSEVYMFSKGNKIVHKSGGPTMIVYEVTPKGKDGEYLVGVRWWDYTLNKFESHIFKVEEIDSAEVLSAENNAVEKKVS